MATEQTPETWEELERLLGSADGGRLAAYLDTLGDTAATILALLPPDVAKESAPFPRDGDDHAPDTATWRELEEFAHCEPSELARWIATGRRLRW